MKLLPHLFRAALALALAASATPAALAALSSDYRVSVYSISFSDLSFANASARYDVHLDMSGQDGDQVLGYAPTVRTGQSNFSWTAGVYSGTSDAFLTVSNVVDPGASGSSKGDLAMVGGTRGAYDFGYDTAAADLTSSFVQRGSAAGRYTLDFHGGGNGLVDAGNLFVLVVFVQGDWTGTNASQLQVLGLNPAFSVSDNFSSYNAGLNATVFAASAISDGSAAFGPDLQFRLTGDVSPVPEPGSAVLLGVGLLLIGVWRRRVPR